MFENKLNIAIGTAALGVVLAIAALVGGNQPVKLDEAQLDVIAQKLQGQNLGGITNFDTLQLEDGVITASSSLQMAATSTVKNLTLRNTTYSSSSPSATALCTPLTLTAGEFQNYRYISYTPNNLCTILSLPASSTLTSFAPNTGDEGDVFIQNATTTTNGPGGGSLRIAGGTGTFLSLVGTTTASTTAGSLHVLRCIRQANTDLTCAASVAQKP